MEMPTFCFRLLGMVYARVFVTISQDCLRIIDLGNDFE